MGGPSLSDYEKLQAEMSDLKIKHKELLASHEEKCREVGLEFIIVSGISLDSLSSMLVSPSLCF